MTFTRNEVCGTDFVKVSFISVILRMASPLGEKFIFVNFLGKTKISIIFRLSVYTHVVLLIHFPKQFELCFYFKYWMSYEVL